MEKQLIDQRIICWGMSCVGKTTFAKQLFQEYIAFDSLYPWHLIETLGLSTSAALLYVKETCESKATFVLDGWNLADKTGVFFPHNICVYVIYAHYDKIINQYRIPVEYFDQHKPMYKQWYKINFLEPRRYFYSGENEFYETSVSEFNKVTNI